MLNYKRYFEDFLTDIYEPSMSSNKNGMSSPDMFTLFIALKNIKPDIVIESGVWNGWSTNLIRKSVGEDCKIICLDPRDGKTIQAITSAQATLDTYKIG